MSASGPPGGGSAERRDRPRREPAAIEGEGEAAGRPSQRRAGARPETPERRAEQRGQLAGEEEALVAEAARAPAVVVGALAPRRRMPGERAGVGHALRPDHPLAALGARAASGVHRPLGGELAGGELPDPVALGGLDLPVAAGGTDQVADPVQSKEPRRAATSSGAMRSAVAGWSQSNGAGPTGARRPGVRVAAGAGDGREAGRRRREPGGSSAALYDAVIGDATRRPVHRARSPRAAGGAPRAGSAAARARSRRRCATRRRR